MFKGKVSPNTIKIKVRASSPESTKVDNYFLKNYKAHNTTFTYGTKPK